ncbi:hypothetical protein GF369_00335 [Candidatus Peregrinibacteria bacterium]|nr:hypothetical protein [Candidatus Peregrinibacteria bacterium]
MRKIHAFVIFTITAVFLTGCSSTSTTQDKTQPDSDQQLQTRAVQTLGALKNKNMGYLSTLAHPKKGIRFSPYATIDPENDVVLTVEEIKNIRADSRSFVWGRYDGTGEQIKMPFMEYMDEFVYDRDFLNAEETAKNEFIGSGNSINNLETVYPDAQFFEYHFSGFNPEYGGMDWVSLRLVFEEYKGKWYVVGIVHDQWTI